MVTFIVNIYLGGFMLNRYGRNQKSNGEKDSKNSSQVGCPVIKICNHGWSSLYSILHCLCTCNRHWKR